MTVTSEKNGPVTTVILSRAHARNAVDPETAAELVAAFEAFEADDEARVGVFFGDHGAFCAGADLKAFAGGGDWRDWVRADGSTAPMGPSRMVLSKPVIAAVAGYAVAGGLELTSKTTRLTPRTSLVIRLEIRCIRSYGRRVQSAVIASMLSTTRTAMTHA